VQPVILIVNNIMFLPTAHKSGWLVPLPISCCLTTLRYNKND